MAVAIAGGALAQGTDAQLRTAYEAYASGDYESAMYEYERILRSPDPRVQIRSLISLAMIRLLPSSKMRDAEAAQLVLDELDRRIRRHQLEHEFFGEVELLRQVGRQQVVVASNKAEEKRLRRELEKRDEIIRQLRALTVEETYQPSQQPLPVEPSSQAPAQPAQPAPAN